MTRYQVFRHRSGDFCVADTHNKNRSIRLYADYAHALSAAQLMNQDDRKERN